MFLCKVLESLDAPITKNYYLAALIGVLVTFPSIMPSVNAINRSKDSRGSEDLEEECKFRKYIALEGKLWKMPLLYSIVNVIGFYIINNYFPLSLRKYWFVGMLMGLFYPTLGTIGDYAKKAYGVTNYYQLYLWAQMLYVGFYGIVVSTIVYLIV